MGSNPSDETGGKGTCLSDSLKLLGRCSELLAWLLQPMRQSGQATVVVSVTNSPMERTVASQAAIRGCQLPEAATPSKDEAPRDLVVREN